MPNAITDANRLRAEFPSHQLALSPRRISSATPTRSNSPERGCPLNVIQRKLGHANHRGGARETSADDAGERRPAVLTRRMEANAGALWALPRPPGRAVMRTE